jgi:hypothetical protein
MFKKLIAAILAVRVFSNILKSGTITFVPAVADNKILDENLDTSVELSNLSSVTIESTYTTVFNSVLVVYKEITG